MSETNCKGNNYCHYPYELKPLPYAYDALEPQIDKETVTIHHDRHLQNYVNNLNAALEQAPEQQELGLSCLLKQIDTLSAGLQTAVRNNGGGVYNHNFYFDMMEPGGKHTPGGALAQAIEKEFGSYETFKQTFDDNAKSLFGSGYTWLVFDENNKNLKILNTANQETPLQYHCLPLIVIDVWEHAYYLKYQNKRVDYIPNWFDLVNWDKAEKLYDEYMAK